MSDTQPPSDPNTTPTQGWWPDDYAKPAFEVRREAYGAIKGGDYVRGSEGKLPRTAIRYSDVEGRLAAQGQGFLAARPYDHETVEITWTVPPTLRYIWKEMAIVRSMFGAPSTVKDGVTVERMTTKAFYHEGSAPIIPSVYDLNVPGGGGKAGLVPGRWYYYSLFFRVNPVDWIRNITTSVLLPRDFHHADHLWNNVPPYYQGLDDEINPDRGPLRTFLRIFGFELDNTREFIESMQEMYHFDSSPMRLLRRVGENLGYTYESGLGDIRYRALLAKSGSLLEIRGTSTGLEQLIEATSKYQTTVTGAENLLLLPDDSDFYGTGIDPTSGTGNWAGVHPDTPMTLQPSPTPWDKVILTTNPTGTVTLPADVGRGSMEMKTYKDEETMPVVITCGCGITADDQREIIPKLSGIPVDAGRKYGFRIQVKMDTPSQCGIGLLWFNSAGQPGDLIHTDAESPFTPPDWHEFTISKQAPADAAYVVPAVYFMTRMAGGDSQVSPSVDLAGAMVYDLGDADAPVATLGPDRYLTMGDPAEKIGPPKSDYEGYLIGAPR